MYGCCEDGVTHATGHHGKGCNTSCDTCDQVTPAAEQSDPAAGQADCSVSQWQCCPDGVTPAQGPGYRGCDQVPGQQCGQVRDVGHGDNYIVQWYYDTQEGKCSQFWYKGEGGNDNRFQDEKLCFETCVNPPGSAKCYLPK